MIKFMFYTIGILWFLTVISISFGAPDMMKKIFIGVILLVSVISIVGSLIFFYNSRDEKKDYLY